MTESQPVTIFTDGACIGNPGPGGFGVVLIFGEHRKELSGGFSETTNNRMELLAVIKGLEALKKPCRVKVFSDSQYVVDRVIGGGGGIHAWKANGWTRVKGRKPIRNLDLWKQLYPFLSTHEIVWEWVKGHAGNKENERCDWLASHAARGPNLPPDLGFIEQQQKDSAQQEFF